MPGFHLMSSTAVAHNITLKGSCDIVSEFFGFSVNSILYQRGVYPDDSFLKVAKYGMNVYVTKNEKLDTYLKTILGQLKDWLLKDEVQKLVLIIVSTETKEVSQR